MSDKLKTLKQTLISDAKKDLVAKENDESSQAKARETALMSDARELLSEIYSELAGSTTGREFMAEELEPNSMRVLEALSGFMASISLIQAEKVTVADMLEYLALALDIGIQVSQIGTSSDFIGERAVHNMESMMEEDHDTPQEE